MVVRKLSPAPAQRMRALRRYNAIASALYFVQALLIIVLSNGFSIPLTASYIQGPPGSTIYEEVVLLQMPTALMVAMVLLISGLTHLYLVMPTGLARYGAELAVHRQTVRWLDWCVTSSLMVVVIAQIASISNVLTLTAVGAVNAAAILFAMLQEKYEVPRTGGLLPLLFGGLMGIIPWGMFAFILSGLGGVGAARTPAYVYGIVLSQLLAYTAYATITYFHHRQSGKVQDYLVMESALIALGFAAKAALAWSVYAGVLAG